MATIRKRSWTTPDGERQAWVVDYLDSEGRRRLKTFQRKRAANDFLTTVRHEVREGTHVAERASITLQTAIDQWLDRARAEGLERSTIGEYELHARHILAQIPGSTKLAKLTPATCEQVRDGLMSAHARPSAKKILQHFKAILNEARRRHQIARNPAADTRIERTGRHEKRLEVGVDVPMSEEIQAMLAAADTKGRAFVSLAAFAGLRASELRGLAWSRLKLDDHPAVTIAERADKWGKVGSPKSASARRTVPLGEATVRALKEWRLAQPPGRTLVFGTARDKPDLLGNIQRRALDPLQIAAGITDGFQTDRNGKPKLDKDGRPLPAAKYSVHALRHYAITMWLKRGHDFKAAQRYAGHGSLALTLDRYGHFIPDADAHARMSEIERSVLG